MRIDEMEAGRELDRLVAKWIFKKTVLDQYPDRSPRQGLRDDEILTWDAAQQHYKWYKYQCSSVPTVPPYSTDDAAAFQVVDKMRAESWGFQLTVVRLSDRCVARFVNLDLIWRGIANTRALAICRAALKAMKEGADED